MLNCVVCHDPHEGVVQLREAGLPSTRTECENCHFKEAQNQKNNRHMTIGLTCIQCHMPKVVKSAWGETDRFTGDIRSHVMAIDPKLIEQFSEDGTVANSQISLNFACRQCHLPDTVTALDDETLISAATEYHSAPVTTEE